MRIALVNMPFSSLQIPSIALHQLETVLQEKMGTDVEVSVHYLNHDFGALVGTDLYAWISESLAGHTCGFGEWLFRSAAFPEAADNTSAYFDRYQHHFGADQVARYYRELAPVRAKLPQILTSMIETHDLLNADIVGLTSMFFQNTPSFALARRLKDMGSKAVTVVGGANCEGTMGIEIVNNVPAVDYVFSGHALVNFPQFVRSAEKGDHAQMSSIDGVFSRQNSRSVAAPGESFAGFRPGDIKAESLVGGIGINGPERSINEAIDLNYSVYLNSYRRHFGSHRADDIELLFETSRGCWWGEKAHCTFCGLNGATMSFREMGVVLASKTIQDMVDRYSDDVSRFASVDNIIPKPYIDKLLPDLKMPDHVNLFYEVKADLTREQLQKLAQARVLEVQPGVESLSTETLKLMRKGTTAFNNIRFLADCAGAGIKPIWNLLVGFPGESAETFEMYARNLPRLMHILPPSGVFPVRFDRFSPYFNKSEEFGLDLEPLDYHEFIYPFAPEIISNMSYYFKDRNVESPYQVDLARNLGFLREQVGRWRQAWESPAGAPRLRLVHDEYGFILQDQRNGHRLEHELSDDDVALLRKMEHPQSIAEMQALNPESYAFLMEIGVLFEERSRVMSLVMEGIRYELDTGLFRLGHSKSRAETAALALTF
jgi:ribosomal peptide maturation radical SAM protein 1